MSITKIHLLVIDPQNDFCDPKGSLFVQGADKDMKTLATFVKRVHTNLDDIHCTLDSHHNTDIAHPIWWKDSKGNHPNPFTLISVKDVENGVWTPTIPSLYKRSLDYVKALEKGGKFALVVWPPHCLIGTWGNNVYTPLLESFNEFEKTPGNMVNFVTKGSNPFTEHYSVFRAEVPDPADPTTQLNAPLVDVLQNKCDMLILAGEARSHCVASSIRDLADAFGNDKYVQKITFLTDCSSNVPGFEKQGEDFVNEMVKRGMNLAKSTEVLI